MKKSKILSLIMALVMTVSAFSMLAMTVSAEVPARPTTLPTGTNILRTYEWLDDAAIDATAETSTTLSDGYYEVTSSAKQDWNKNFANTDAWRGATGIMFYIDASAAEEKVDFFAEFLLKSSRGKADNTKGGYVQLNNFEDGAQSVAYYYDSAKNEWTEFDNSAATDKRFLTPATGSGWYYLPFTSVYYKGQSGAAPAGDLAVGLNFTEFMERYEEGCYLSKISMRSYNVGLKFADFQFVYEDKSDIEGTFTEALFGGDLESVSAEGNATVEVSNGEYTVKGLLDNTATSSANRAWLKSSSNTATSLIDTTNLKKAQGIKFYVDTTALGSEAQLRLRIRLFLGKSTVTGEGDAAVNGLGEGVFGKDVLGYSSTQSNGYDQYVARVNGAAYYYDADGNPVPLYGYAGSASSENAGRPDKDKEGDYFDALPANYKGYIYIPMDSFGYSISDYGDKVILPWEYVAERYPIHRIGICGFYEGTAQTDAVTYSNFEVVYSQQFTVTFDVEGTETETVVTGGALPVYPDGIPTKAETDEFAYEFIGWDKELVIATENTKYTAQFKAIPKYTVTFIVEGKETKVVVKEGEVPSYPGLPIKAADDTYKYSFEKWDKDVVAATGDATYTAVFTATAKNANVADDATAADTTEAADTTTADTTTAATEDNMGCESAIGLASVAVVVMAMGTAIVVKKKDD